MAWVMLALAGLFETGFAIALKYSDNFSKPVPSVLFVIFAVASFSLLAAALKHLPIGTAYAVWTGIGAAGTALAGIAFLGEPAAALRLVAIGLIVAGVVALQAAGAH